ncbi:MAG: DUF6600 domain-containing protein, partial [Syntrophobacteraceae bacterium]
MRKAYASLWAFLILSILIRHAGLSFAADEARTGNVLVGRISHIEGELLYYVAESKDWVAAVADGPSGLDDAFYSGDDSRAEFIMPNRTRLRIGPTTQVQVIALKDDLSQIDVASGSARFLNDSDSAIIKATTPFGYAVAEAGGSFDLYVGNESVEVIALEGVVYYVGNERSSKYEVIAGSSILADDTTVTESNGTVDADWQEWNEKRDAQWTSKIETRGDSINYIPSGLYDQASVLDEHGRWEDVYYEGESRRLWRPTAIASDWRPFTAGRWTVYHGDSAWIPEAEPFGYVTHHYGNWVYLDSPGYWYWMPPALVAPVRPGFDLSFSWYPGRVSWLHSSLRVGWFPIAPFEPYYAHRYWGPRTFVVGAVPNISININSFRFADHAVVIPQNNLFGVRNYRNILIRDLNRAAIARDFRAAPFIDRRVIRNFRRMNQRFQFTPGRISRVPHNAVLQRIQNNRRLAARSAQLRASTVEQRLSRLRPGSLNRGAALQQPRVTNRLVRRNEANQARRQLRLRQREIKSRPVQLQRVQERRERAAELRQRRQQQRSQLQPEARQRLERRQQLQEQRQQRTQALQQRQQQQRQQLQNQRQPRAQRLQRQRSQQQRQQRLQRQRSQQQRQQRLQRQRSQQQRQQRLQRQRSQQQRQQRLQRQRSQQQRQQRLQRQRSQQQRQQRLQRQRSQQQRQQRLQRQRSQQQRQQRLQRQQRSRQQLQRRQQARQAHRR